MDRKILAQVLGAVLGGIASVGIGNYATLIFVMFFCAKIAGMIVTARDTLLLKMIAGSVIGTIMTALIVLMRYQSITIITSSLVLGMFGGALSGRHVRGSIVGAAIGGLIGVIVAIVQGTTAWTMDTIGGILIAALFGVVVGAGFAEQSSFRWS